MTNNPLDQVMAWHKTASDSLRMSRRTLEKEIGEAISDKYEFSRQPIADSISRLNAAKEELERLVVLALTAIFERTLRDYLAQIPNTALPPGIALNDAVRVEIAKDIEFWNISSRVLEIFPDVQPEVKGQAKQIIDFRNWIAHGHTLSKPAPSNVAPARAHQLFTDFLTQAGII